MSRCLGSDSIASRDGSEANMSSFLGKLHEDSVARPHFPPEKREAKNLGVLGCKNPTVMITRTRSVASARMHLDTGIVDSGAICRVKNDTVQLSNLVP